MTEEKKTSPTKQAPRKRGKAKSQARKPHAALPAAGQPAEMPQASAPKPPGHQRGKTTSGPTVGQEPNASRTLATIPLHVRWRDLDAFNHVNNSSYLTYLEESRLQWLRLVPGEWFNAHAMPVMAAVELHYRRPIEWPSEIDVLLSCERLGTTSMTIGNRIVDRNDASLVYAEGEVVMVWIDPATGAAVPLPDAIRNACSSS
ncbi:MAG TPA: thioesterase family protein [Rhodanobacteraceae bacterium]|nr:thioesterase family protein [Rhodanobacteraceae bacterium]